MRVFARTCVRAFLHACVHAYACAPVCTPAYACITHVRVGAEASAGSACTHTAEDRNIIGGIQHYGRAHRHRSRQHHAACARCTRGVGLRVGGAVRHEPLWLSPISQGTVWQDSISQDDIMQDTILQGTTLQGTTLQVRADRHEPCGRRRTQGRRVHLATQVCRRAPNPRRPRCQEGMLSSMFRACLLASLIMVHLWHFFLVWL